MPDSGGQNAGLGTSTNQSYHFCLAANLPPMLSDGARSGPYTQSRVHRGQIHSITLRKPRRLPFPPPALPTQNQEEKHGRTPRETQAYCLSSSESEVLPQQQPQLRPTSHVTSADTTEPARGSGARGGSGRSSQWGRCGWSLTER